MINISVTGIKALSDLIPKIIASADLATREGLRNTLKEIAEESLSECPLDTGELRESMLVKVNRNTIMTGNANGTPNRAGNITERKQGYNAEITYNTPYAVKQHEDMSLRHTNGGKAKFLEDPLKKYEGKLKENISLELRRKIK